MRRPLAGLIAACAALTSLALMTTAQPAAADFVPPGAPHLAGPGARTRL